MPNNAEITRSDSNRSDVSQKPRVSFNRDVHVKRIVPIKGNLRVVSNGETETGLKSPNIRKESVKKTKKELEAEAAEVLKQADRVECVANNRGAIDEKFFSLPHKKNVYSNSLERPPQKPPRIFSSDKNSTNFLDFFHNKPKKSNLRRSISDASALREKSKNNNPIEELINIKKINKSTKKQLSPIIEITQREDYFTKSDLENGTDEIDDGLVKKTIPTPIIIDVDKAENITSSNNKKYKINFNLAKKFKSLKNPKKAPENNDKINLEKMIHSSQMPADKPPLTKGKTVNSMIKRLSTDLCSSPPPTRTNISISPNVSVQHNNNQPFSYIRGHSPEKYKSNEDLPNFTKPVIYAQVVCAGQGNGKQTIHTSYNNGRKPQNSDSDEGLGGEDSFQKSFPHFGDENYQSETEKLIDEIDKYKAESPIMPKYRQISGFSSYMERGRGDGMDAKLRESAAEAENVQNLHDLSARRDLLESRINRRITEKVATPSPEYYPTKPPRSNFYRTSSNQLLEDWKDRTIEKRIDDGNANRILLHKDRNFYKSTPEIYNDRSCPLRRSSYRKSSYHDSLPREEKFRSEHFLNREESDRRTDRFADSGIENDFRIRKGNRSRRPTTTIRNRNTTEFFNESEDEGFASSLLIPNPAKDFVSCTERSNTHDGSHFDSGANKKIIKKIDKKPPIKPEKKSFGLEKVKSLFTRDKKEKNGLVKKSKWKSSAIMQEEKQQSQIDPRNRRRLSTPSPTRDSSSHRWFKSLDRLTKRKEKRYKNNNNSEDERSSSSSKKFSSSTNNLRFFGDTDQESNNSMGGGTKKRLSHNLHSQSTRDLHDISEEKHSLHHKSFSNLNSERKPPLSPQTQYPHPPPLRRRYKRQDFSSLESSEGDSSQQSQKSVVYLHAATVGDIPGPGYLKSNRAASREDLTSNNSSFSQPQVKTLSRSFSVLAPWKPRYQKESLDIDYTQYKKNGFSSGTRYEHRNNSRSDNSTLKKRAQENRKNFHVANNNNNNNNQWRSRENLSSSNGVGSSSSTLYKKREKLPRENARYKYEDKKMTTKSHSVESIARKSKERPDHVSRSSSMPRDSEKTAGWFRKSKKSTVYIPNRL